MSAPQIFFITGVSSGFGRAIADAALAAGHRVVGTVRQSFQVADLAAAYSSSFHAVELDLADVASIRQAVAEGVSVWNGLDVLINNAGYGLVGALEEYDDSQIAYSLAVNLTGPLQVIRAALPHFRAQKSGRIITIGAIAAVCNDAGFSVYGGAKAAMDAASESLRAELAPLGIHVSLVHPGPFRTDFIARSLDAGTTKLPDYEPTTGAFAKILSRINGRQPGDPAKAAQAILQLAFLDSPPLRLYLGKYACGKIRQRLSSRLAELTISDELGLATDY